MSEENFMMKIIMRRRRSE